MTIPEELVRQAILALQDGDFVATLGEFDVYQTQILDTGCFIAIKLIPNKPLFIGSIKPTLDEVKKDIAEIEAIKTQMN
jgi:hypothetical protein